MDNNDIDTLADSLVDTIRTIAGASMMNGTVVLRSIARDFINEVCETVRRLDLSPTVGVCINREVWPRERGFFEEMVPSYQTSGASGADLCSAEHLTLKAGTQKAVRTGIALEVPNGYEAQVRPRSGFAAKSMVTITNSPGTIDSDYRGEVFVLLINHGPEDLYIRKGDRIAQLVIAEVMRASFEVHEGLTETERGAGGLGSTGVE